VDVIFIALIVALAIVTTRLVFVFERMRRGMARK
jgi:hypothetical protein